MKRGISQILLYFILLLFIRLLLFTFFLVIFFVFLFIVLLTFISFFLFNFLPWMDNYLGDIIIDGIAILIQFDHSSFVEFWLFLLYMLINARLPFPWLTSAIFIICLTCFAFLLFCFLFGLRLVELCHLISIFFF